MVIKKLKHYRVELAIILLFVLVVASISIWLPHFFAIQALSRGL